MSESAHCGLDQLHLDFSVYSTRLIGKRPYHWMIIMSILPLNGCRWLDQALAELKLRRDPVVATVGKLSIRKSEFIMHYQALKFPETYSFSQKQDNALQ